MGKFSDSIASVHFQEDRKEFGANAKLIAAAPDLLEALENVVLQASGEANVEHFLMPARAAIAKALGK